LLELRACKICNKQFQPKQHNHICCSKECSREWGKIKSKECRRKLRASRKKPKPKSLRELSIEAATHRMSYGKYVAMLEAQGRSDAIARK
jgi:hypothetical protein